MADVPKSLRIAIGGGSGLVGSALIPLLKSVGHSVVQLVRRPPRDACEVFWDPAGGVIDDAPLNGLDAAVPLGGTGVAQGRWTAERKAEIRNSRVNSTDLLSRTLAHLNDPPATFICASATGYYGDRGDEMLTEESSPGTGFLPDVCRLWESATEPARQAGIRVVNLRTGVVLSANGGALRRMLLPFKLGLGGVVGSGRQYMSWIALTDLVGAIEFLLTAEAVSGPVNAVAPNAVSNRDFTRALGRVLRRPTLLPLPAFAVRAAFGEMGEVLLLEGCRVHPTRLENAGFSFLYPELEETLRHELMLERPHKTCR